MFDLDYDEVTQGEVSFALAKEEERVRVFNDWYALNNSMTDPATFPSFDVRPPQDIVDYYNEVGVFDHTPELAYYREVTMDRFLLGSNKARTVDQLIGSFPLAYVIMLAPQGWVVWTSLWSTSFHLCWGRGVLRQLA